MSMETELAINRKQTQAFIAARPSTVILTPRRREKTGSGTRWIEGAPRTPQIMRLIEQGPAEHTSRRGGDGVQRQVTYQLLGSWDAEIGLYDTWIDAQGIRWEIRDLLTDNGYERRAMVVRYGET